MKGKSAVRVSGYLFFAFLCITGCASPVDDAGVRDLRWKSLGTFAGDVDEYAQYLAEHDMRPLAGNEFAYMGREPRLLVLTDVTDMAALQNHVRPEHQRQIAKVDFSRFWAAVIYRGYTKQLDSTISVDAVQLLSDTVTIAAQFETLSTDEESQTSQLTSPYLIVRIRKPADVVNNGIVFNLDVGDQTISAQCTMDGEALTWAKLRFWYQAGNYSYGDVFPMLSVITDYETWMAFQRVAPQEKSLVSRDDFSSAFVAIVYQGLKSTTGFEIEVLSIRQQENTIVICVRFQEPYPGQAVGQAMTSPYYMIKVDRTAEMQGEASFVLCTDKQEIARQTVILP